MPDLQEGYPKIPLFKVAMSSEAGGAVGNVLNSGFIGQGPKVEEFEAALAARLGTDRVVTVNSATSGLHLAVHMVATSQQSDSQQAGGEVLTTPLTCTATNWPILANGLDIRWVDVESASMNMDLDDLARKITPRTRAIMVMHWGGYPVDLDRLRTIQDLAERLYGQRPVVIEDCAHAWGATYQQRPVGTHGNIAVFSFQAIKHLTCGDGGAMVLPDDQLKARAKLLRWYGIDRDGRADFRCESDVTEYGFKFHMNDISATIGLANLQNIDNVLQRHRENAEFYDSALRDVPGLQVTERRADRKSSYWLYTISVDNRDAFVKKMTEAGIMVSRVHERNDIHSCVRQYAALLPNLEQVVSRMICIPAGWWVSDADREYIAATIRAGW